LNFLQLEWDNIGPTFTAIKGQYLKHPEFLEKSSKYHRLITWREGARLQEFPDRFKFTGGFSKKIKQVAWGVPCKGIQFFIKAIMKVI